MDRTKMHVIATARFNSKTWDENERWRNNNSWEGCIYGTPLLIKESISLNVPMFVLEMQNDTNTVKGVGLIRNSIAKDKRYRVYEDGNYNRYTYKSKYRVDRADMSKKELLVIKMFDVLLFKGSRHLKRARGITAVPDWMSKNNHIDFIKFFRKLFHVRYNQ
jgi:hypothetical protein